MSQTLHVITYHANPMGWESRRRLFGQFDDYITQFPGIDFGVVELCYPGSVFEVGADLKLQSPDLMWHKENALNQLVKTLPDWNYLAWIDADLTFANPNWPQAIIEALHQYPVVQCFSEAYQLSPDNEPLPKPYQGMIHSAIQAQTRSERPRHSPWAHLHTGQSSIQPPMARRVGRGIGHPGFAWACTREAWDLMGGLADINITGSADRHMAMAFMGAVERCCPDMTPAMLDWWMAWQARIKPLQGQVGAVKGTLYHAWHGSRIDRQYNPRHRILRDNGPEFDPALDLAPDPETGLWRFTDRGERFREPLRQYFAGRNEDSREIG